MTKLEDGPAAGNVLNLRRAPLLLRVTITPAGEVDALDQLDDEPAPHEAIHVYLLGREPMTGFVDGTDKRGRRFGHQITIAAYFHYERQPSDADARDSQRWQLWCQENRNHANETHRALARRPTLTP